MSPAGQPKYILTLPNNTTVVQASNIFTFKNAGPNNNGNYVATYVDAAGCRSGSSNVVSVTVNPPTLARLLPATQTVAFNGIITFMALPADGDLYVLTKPNGETISQSSPVFTIEPATPDDEGTYSVTVTAHGCPPSTSDLAEVKLGGGCGLSIGLTAQPACLATDTGSITVTFGGAKQVNYAINGAVQPGLVSSPFTIEGLQPNQNYTISISVPGPCSALCTTQATIRVGVDIAEPPALSVSSVCQGGNLTFTVLPADQKSYTLTLPDNTTLTQVGDNIFTITNASSVNNGDYSATYISQNDCQSPASNVVMVTVNPLPPERLRLLPK